MEKLSKKKTSKKHDVTHCSIGNWRKKLGVKYYGHSGLAQLVERLPVKEIVAGSSPASGDKKTTP